MENLYMIFKEFHNLARWLILALAVITLLSFMYGHFTKKIFGKSDNLTCLLYMIFCDIQLLVGLVLYIYLSPNTNQFDFDMSNSASRFQTVEHPLTMLIAIIFVHVGRSAVKKASSDDAKFKKGLIWFSLSLIFMLLRMPWN